jgi:hypothetical protein
MSILPEILGGIAAGILLVWLNHRLSFGLALVLFIGCSGLIRWILDIGGWSAVYTASTGATMVLLWTGFFGWLLWQRRCQRKDKNVAS